MKFINSIGDKAKNTLLKSIASLIEKNPQSNLPKIIKLSKLLTNDSSSIEMINSFELSYNQIPDFKKYIDDLIENTDYKIMNNFVVNILGKNLSLKNKHSNISTQNESSPHSLIIDSNSLELIDQSLNYNNIDKIISDSKKIGIFTFIITGTEPLSLDFLYDIYEKYSDSLFIPITKEKCISDSSCKKIIKCGNVVPMFQYNNDNMDFLRKNGVPSFNMMYLQKLLKQVKSKNNLSNIKTFSLEFNGSSQKKLIKCSLSDLIARNSI